MAAPGGDHAGWPLSGLIVFTWLPSAEGHGTDAAIEAIHHKRGHIRARIPPIKLIASAITIGSGGSGGREGPTLRYPQASAPSCRAARSLRAGPAHRRGGRRRRRHRVDLPRAAGRRRPGRRDPLHPGPRGQALIPGLIASIVATRSTASTTLRSHLRDTGRVDARLAGPDPLLRHAGRALRPGRHPLREVLLRHHRRVPPHPRAARGEAGHRGLLVGLMGLVLPDRCPWATAGCST